MNGVSPAEAHRQIAAAFTVTVEAASPVEWDDPAPPDGWVARDVVRHLTEWFPPFLEQGSGVALAPGPSVEDDPAGAWRHQAAAVQAVLEDPATADRRLADPNVGELPLAEAIDRFYTADVFMHRWDLAIATGQVGRLDPAICEELLAGMEPMDDALRASGHFGPRVDVPADADAQTRLLAFIGRNPETGT